MSIKLEKDDIKVKEKDHQDKLETYEEYKKKNKKKWSIKDYTGIITIILIVLALFIIPIAEAISGFYYYNKHEHENQNINTSSLYSYDEAQDIINEDKFLQYQDKVPQKIKEGYFLTLEDRKEIAKTERQNEKSWKQNIRTEEQI